MQPHTTAIRTLFSTIAPELHTINAHRYNRQISPGLQEYLEARIFQHYIETQTILGYDAACADIAQLAVPPPSSLANTNTNDSHSAYVDGNVEREGREEKAIETAALTPDDYLLALFDATGEMMRFAITSMASVGAGIGTDVASSSSKDLAVGNARPPRSVVQDLQQLRVLLSNIDARSRFVYPMSKAVSGKMGVMLTSVEKVERALYGLCVRGKERPRGWMPDLSEAAGGAAGGDVDGD